MKLNLGCGSDIEKDFVNLDYKKGEGVDCVHDLNKFPYPFGKDTFSYIRAYSIIEHLPDTVKVIQELYRILADGGELDIIVPHYLSSLAYGNPTHIKYFGYDTFFFFVKNGTQEKEEYSDIKFSSIQVEFQFSKNWKQPHNYLLESFANKFPHVYENTPLRMFPCLGLRIRLIKSII